MNINISDGSNDYQERVEERMSGESKETEDEVGDVIPHLRISADLPEVS